MGEGDKEKKKPLYMKTFSPEKNPADDLDIYDGPPIGPEDENPKKKKRKPRKPRKPQAKKTLMTLAFDSNETKIASVVKKKFNAESAKKITRPPGRKLKLQ